MTAITASNTDLIRPSTSGLNTILLSLRAGEALTQGDALAFDKSSATPRVYQVDHDDANRQNFIGFANADASSGGVVSVQVSGIISGWDFAPSTTATHRVGNYVYTGDEGAIDDAPALGCMIVGSIVPRNDGQGYGILIQPQQYQPKNNFYATVAPDGDNDIDEGYTVGSIWVDVTGGDAYIMDANADGSASWVTIGTTA